MRIKTRPAQYILCALLIFPGSLPAAGEPSASCSQNEWDAYFSDMQNHVIANWQPPYNYRRLSCTILLRLNFRGEVAHVEIIDCDDDVQVRKSAENAAYYSSPLPKPKNKACFVKQVTVRLVFKP